MHIMLLSHYPLSAGLSMRSFTALLQEALEGRGHRVSVDTAPVILGGLSNRPVVRKWLGYIDCFVLFPLLFRWRQIGMARPDLYVFSDQALGPWLPLLGCRPNVIHCHDFLALQSALDAKPRRGRLPHAPTMGRATSLSGQLYQRLIRWGFRQGRCFLCVSESTRRQLGDHLLHPPALSAVLPNPISARFAPMPASQCESLLRHALGEPLPQRFLLHVGTGWYKNRLGVLQIWEQLRLHHHAQESLQLVLVGGLEPDLKAWLADRPQLTPWLQVLENASDQQVVALYTCAVALLFPSIAEGFGWPVIEALACGCAVVTTAVQPMTDVGGPWINTIPPAPVSESSRKAWSREAAIEVDRVLAQDPDSREAQRLGGLRWASRFHINHWSQRLELHYRRAQQLQQGNLREVSP
jgi:glycosyltransferase involved in cell wall biosynthesis